MTEILTQESSKSNIFCSWCRLYEVTAEGSDCCKSCESMRIADYDDCHEVDVRELFGKPVSTDARYWHVGPYNQLTIPKEHIDALNSFGLEYVGRILFVENFGYYFYVKGTVSRWVNAYAKLDWLE